MDQIDVSGYVFQKNSVDCSSMTPQANAKVNSLMNYFLYNGLLEWLLLPFCPQNFGGVGGDLRMIFSHSVNANSVVGTLRVGWDTQTLNAVSPIHLNFLHSKVKGDTKALLLCAHTRSRLCTLMLFAPRAT